jgi:glycine betaine/proline transport system ATP-binding protein
LRDFRLHKASMVFQRFALLPHRSVAENVAYGLKNQGVAAAEIEQRVAHWLDRVGLGGYEDHYPAQLSGGMQQRVGLARALATDADILLMDEAFSALDPLIRNDMQGMLLDLQGELHKTIVFITHDLDEALRIGDRIAILRAGEVIQQGDPQEIVLAPADAYIADFVKDINRSRVIKLGSIMQPPTDDVSGPRLDAGTVLEDAARAIVETGETAVLVTNGSGGVVGAVTAADLMSSMVRPDGDEPVPHPALPR